MGLRYLEVSVARIRHAFFKPPRLSHSTSCHNHSFRLDKYDWDHCNKPIIKMRHSNNMESKGQKWPPCLTDPLT